MSLPHTASSDHELDVDLMRAWARRRLAGPTLILDTETTTLHGQIIQLAVITTTGQAVMSTLVKADEPIDPAARAVHGLSDADIAGAPRFEQIAPQLLKVTRGCHLLAYCAEYDKQVILAELGRAGIDPQHLAEQGTWECLMTARQILTGGPRTRLGGPHTALGDCQAALAVLEQIASWPETSA